MRVLAWGLLALGLADQAKSEESNLPPNVTTTSAPVSSSPGPLSPGQLECMSSWDAYFAATLSSKYGTSCEPRVDHSWELYKTRVEVGDSELYSVCDGITRLRFKKPPSSFTESHFTVEKLYSDRRCRDQSSLFREPTCSFYADYYHSTCNAKLSMYKSMLSSMTSGLNEFDFYHQTNSDLPKLGECEPEQTCFVDMGDEVVLIYWPPEVSSHDVCAMGENRKASTVSMLRKPRVVTMDAITFKGQDLVHVNQGLRSDYSDPKYLASVLAKYSWPQPYTLTGPFTLTSPTVYMAHKAITMMPYEGPEYFGRWGDKSSVHSPGIVAMRPEEVFSVRRKHNDDISGLQYARLVANGSYRHFFHDDMYYLDSLRPQEYDMLPFDFENLIEPVPASVYYDAREDCWGNQTHCATITEGSYRPQLAFKRRFWDSIVPSFGEMGCHRPAVVDPPIAAMPAVQEELVLPTFPVESEPMAQQPQPGSFANSPWPTPTPANQELSTEISWGNPHSSQEQPVPVQANHPDSLEAPREEIKFAKIRSQMLVAKFSGGSLVTAYIGAVSPTQDQSTTIDGKIISAARNDVFINGFAATAEPLTQNQLTFIDGKAVSIGLSTVFIDGVAVTFSSRSAATALPGHKSAENRISASRSRLEFSDSSTEHSALGSPSDLIGSKSGLDGKKKSKASQSGKLPLLIIMTGFVVGVILL